MPTRSRQLEYERLNSKYLRQAQALLTKEDYPQASEKLWGACAEMVKAVAAKRRISLGTHRSIGDFILNLHKEHPDWDLMDAFYVANTLHTNFYENWLNPEYITKGGKVIEEFVKKLRRLL